MTTNVDIVFRCGRRPGEAAMLALGKVRDVYGIRRLAWNEQEKTILVEFDFTRLNRDVVAELLRRAGIDAVEEPAPASALPAASPAEPPPAR